MARKRKAAKINVLLYGRDENYLDDLETIIRKCRFPQSPEHAVSAGKTTGQVNLSDFELVPMRVHDRDEMLEVLSRESISLAILEVEYLARQVPGTDSCDDLGLARDLLVRQPGCFIIFTSKDSRYVQDVYEVRHQAFIFKRSLGSRLPNAIARILPAAVSTAPASGHRLAVRSKGTIHLVEENEILYIEHHGREINLRLADGTSIAAYEHIEDILRRLDGCRFFQCHKSYAVNLDAVVSLHGQVFHMIGGASVPVSRSKAAEARNLVTP